MGRHKEWRAQAKKMRRKRMRQKAAQKREDLLRLEEEEREKSPRYQAWVKEQEELEAFQVEEEARLQKERHLKWEHDEEIAQKLWRERQERLAKAREERAKQEMRIREEWEMELKRQRDAEEERKRQEEEKKRRQEELMRKIDAILSKGEELPNDLITNNETHPDKPPCPFFSKTGACRFGDWCSRNHVRPSMSKVLLIPNFYSHFGLDKALIEECDTDVMLEYGDTETYQHFKDFFEDVLPEFERHGRVVQFKVCRNFEAHLRGNVYVEYGCTRDAVAAFKTFQGRWYGGRQLNVEFTCVTSWSSAICGLYHKQRCPKGRSCNFLHVFRNPQGIFDSPTWRRRPNHHHPHHRNRHRSHHHRRNGRSKSRSPSRNGRSKSRSPSRNGRSWSRSPSRNGRSWSRSASRSPTRSSRTPTHSPSRKRKREKRDWRWSESPEPKADSEEEISERRSEKRHGTRESSRSNHSSSARHNRSHRKKHRRRSPGSS